MSVPAQNPASASMSGLTSFVTGQINYGWISDAWRYFSAQMGVWIAATLILFVPSVIFVIFVYAQMWTIMFPTGFPPPTPPMPASGLPTAPLTPGVTPYAMNAQMTKLLPMEIGFGLVYAFWSAFLYGGLFRMAVRQVRGLPIEMRDIFRGGPLFGRMLGAIFLLGFGTYGLEALCLGPSAIISWRHGPLAATFISGGVGIVLFLALTLIATGLLLPSFTLIADGDGVLTALKTSIRAMKGHWAAAAAFVFVVGVLVYVSELPCLLGMLVTIPMVFLICALAYRDMIGMPNMVPLPTAFYPPAETGVWPPAPTNSAYINPTQANPTQEGN